MDKILRIAVAADIHGSMVALLKVFGMAKEARADVVILPGDITPHTLCNKMLLCIPDLTKYAGCKTIITYGNHDNYTPHKYFGNCLPPHFEHTAAIYDKQDIYFLHDNWVNIKGFIIWGSGWSVAEDPLRPDRWYNQKPQHQLVFDIHEEADIAVTHCPPWGYLDTTFDGKNIGSEDLTKKITTHNNLKLHVFGHCHESGGRTSKIYKTILANCAVTMPPDRRGEMDFAINWDAIKIMDVKKETTS